MLVIAGVRVNQIRCSYQKYAILISNPSVTNECRRDFWSLGEVSEKIVMANVEIRAGAIAFRLGF